MLAALINVLGFLALTIIYRIMLFSFHLACGLFGLYKTPVWAFFISILAACLAMLGSISSMLVLFVAFDFILNIFTYLAFGVLVLAGAFNNAQRLKRKADKEGDTINPKTGLTANHARLISQGTFCGAFLGLFASYLLFFSVQYPFFGWSLQSI